MAWEGERGGFYFRLSLFDIEILIKSGRVVGWWGEGKLKKIYRCGPGMGFFKSLIDHLSWQRRFYKTSTLNALKYKNQIFGSAHGHLCAFTDIYHTLPPGS